MKEDPQHPDGAKAGAEVRSPSDKHAFNADGRAKAREDAPITVGGQTFHRRRKNWQVTRKLRELLRGQERAGNKAERLRARVDALTEQIRGVRGESGEWVKQPIDDDAEIEKIETQVEELEAQIDGAQDDADEKAFQMIALLLRDEAGGDPPLDYLKDSLDAEDASDLATVLAGGKLEDLEDPTTTPDSSG